MAICYLLLGGNLGNVLDNFLTAIHHISKDIGDVKMVSSNYKSEPWGYESQNWFFNMAIKIETAMSAIEVLNKTQEIERLIGRTSKTKMEYTDRLIDIDLLDYNKETIKSIRLTLPHPRLHERRFALIPLAEIAPNYHHPHLHQSINEILLSINDTTSIEKLTHQQK